MPAPYGLLSTGYNPATADEVIEEMKQAFRDEWGASLPVDDSTIEGTLISIVGHQIASVWEASEAVAGALDPDAADAAQLDALCAITGTTREDESPSTVTLTLTGTASTVITEGSTVALASDDAVEFTTDEDATLSALTAWASTTAYVVGDRRSNASRSYVCITAGTSAGSGGPTTTSDDITDGTAHWRYMGEGTAAADVAATCTVSGATVATSGDLTSIVTPISGWDSVINLLDADLGRDDETDAALRLRRTEELSGGGVATPDAIRAAVLDVEDVTACRVFYNDTDVTDGDGVPPHAVEVLVLGGDEADIAQAIFDSVAAGIATYGTSSETVTDDEGTDHTVYFTRPTERTIYVDVTLVKDPDEYPDDGDDQVKAAIVEWGDQLVVGKDVTASRVSAAIFGGREPGNPRADAVAGVLDVTDIDIGVTASPPDGTTVTVTSRQIAVFDTSRITVSTSNGTP